MNKNRAAYAVVLILAVLTVSGVILGFSILKAHKNTDVQATIEIDGDTRETLGVSLTGFYPGRKQEYTLNLVYNVKEEYETTLIFEKTDGGSLENYIKTEIEVAGEQIDSGLLETYLGGETVSFSHRPASSKPVKVVIRYTMPLDVGNEAQKTSVDFNILFTTKKIGG